MRKTRAVMVFFHNYVPALDRKYYNVLRDGFLAGINKSRDEFDRLYVIDSNCDFSETEKHDIEEQVMVDSVVFIKPDFEFWTNAHRLLDFVEEDTLAMMHQDMMIFKHGILESVFNKIESGHDIVSVLDPTGSLKDKITEKWPVMNGNAKFCLYLFGMRVALLKTIGSFSFDCSFYPLGTYIKELDYTTKEGDWSEALGDLTIKILGKGGNVFELEEDKTSWYFEDIKGENERGKNLGYYHIRAGGTVSFLLGHRNLGNNQTYQEYIKNQPTTETLRHFAWAWIIDTNHKITKDILEVAADIGLSEEQWIDYINQFKRFHSLHNPWEQEG